MRLVERIAPLAASEYREVKSAVMAFSGGLDSVVIVSLLRGLGIEVTTLSVDFGQQGGTKKAGLAAKALGTKHHSVDGREDLYRNIQKGIKANCLREGRLAAGALSRPLLAKYLAEVAHKEHAHAIAHGSSGVGNDQLRMENAMRVLAPQCRIIAPVRDWDLRRDEEIEYARERKLPIDTVSASKYSVDETFWARVIRQGAVTDTAQSVPESAFLWTKSPHAALEKSARVEIEFLDGSPVRATNLGTGKSSSGMDMVLMLNSLGGAHAIGRMDKINDKVIGLKVREIYECPAAQILVRAHGRLEHLVLTERELEQKGQIDRAWGNLVSQGFWYSRLRTSLDAFIDECSRPVDGTVTYELYKGNMLLHSRKSPHALYDSRLTRRDYAGMWNQKDARHFAKIYGLQEILAFMLEHR